MKPITYRSIAILSLAITLATSAGTNSWTPVSLGPPGTGLSIVRFDEENPLVGYAGPYSKGLFKTSDGGLTWLGVGPSSTASVTDVALDPTSHSTLYGFAFGWPSPASNSVFKSVDGGSSWISSNTGLPTFDSNFQPSPIAADPNNPGTLLLEAHGIYVGSPPAVLFKSSNGGASWTELATIGLSVSRVYQMAFDPFVRGRVYAVASHTNSVNSGLYISADGGVNWSKKAIGGGALPTVIYVDKNLPGTIYLGSNAGPYKSGDSGASWTSAPSGSQSLAIAADAYLPGVVFSGGLSGNVFRSRDRGATYSFLARLPELFPGYAPDIQVLAFQPATKTVFAAGAGSTLYALTVVERPTIALVSPTVVQCPTQRGFEYQLQASTDLSTWKDSGTRQTGDGFVHRFTNSPSEARVTFYQIAVR